MKLHELINQLQEINDKFGECEIEFAHDDNILDSWQIGRVCFFKDGEHQRTILVDED